MNGEPAYVPLHEARREQARPRRDLKTILAPSLNGLPIPERPWLVQSWIPDRAVTLLGGDGGVGKSLVSLQLMVACDTGKPWLGLATKKCRAYGLFCEDDEIELHIRIAAVARHYGVDLADLEGVAYSARSGKANVLMYFPDKGQPSTTKLWAELVEEVKDLGSQIVIIDTLADVFAGNENIRGNARAFVNLLRGLAQEIDGAVVLTSHPSIAGQNSGTGLSGSTAWNNSVRSRLYLTKPTEADADPDARILTRMKANYTGAGERIEMVWLDGVLAPDTSRTGFEGRLRAQRLRRAICEQVAEAWNNGAPLSDKPQAIGRYLPPKVARAAGFKEREVKLAMIDLIAEGQLVIQKQAKDLWGLTVGESGGVPR